MKRLLARANYYTTLLGLDPRRTARTALHLPGFVADLIRLRRQARKRSSPFPFGSLYPCLGESGDSGTARGHYFHQDLLVARRIALHRPRLHVDVGSRIDGFVAHVASFREIVVVDIRKDPGSVPNVRFLQADLMAPGSLGDLRCDSLSCLHVLEHFGLGRYGDPIDVEGHLRGFAGLVRLLEPGGRFYFSVPIGPQRVEFNAHRVFSVRYVLGLLEPSFDVDRFSYVDDAGDLHEDVPLDADAVARSFGCWYGCGIFEARKRSDEPPGAEPTGR